MRVIIPAITMIIMTGCASFPICPEIKLAMCPTVPK